MPGAIPELHEIGPRLEDPAALKSLRSEVQRLLGRGSPAFPGAQPISLLNKHRNRLVSEDFYVCEKSDGIRCLMYMTEADPENDNHKPATFLIDRKNNYYFIQDLRFPIPKFTKEGQPIKGEFQQDGFFKKTLLDGEIVLDTIEDGSQQLKFLVFDALAVGGKVLLTRDFSKRLGYFIEWVLKPYNVYMQKNPRVFDNIPFIVQKKDMQFGYGVEMMFKEIMPKLQHGNDGLIFTSLLGPYICGTDEHILKWKPDYENSIDFRLNLRLPQGSNLHPNEVTTETPYDSIPEAIKWTLSVWAGEGKYRAWGDMYLPPEDWAKVQRAAGDVEVPLENAIVECRWDKHVGISGRWRFMRFRMDKENANFVKVAENVEESIRDGVSKDELIKWAVDIKAGWRKRHPK